MILSRLLSLLFTLPFISLLAACHPAHYVQQHGDMVSLYLKAPETSTIYFASSLDSYALHEAEPVEGGEWRVSVEAGRNFDYFFLIDDRVYVPPCQLSINDDFGSKNCIFEAQL